MGIDDRAGGSNGFDPDFAAASDWARLYRANGVQVVPCKNKIPRLKAWKEYQNALVPDAQFEAWYGHGGEFAQSYDMGMLTGTASGRILMIDLDLYKAGGKALRWWQGVLAVHNNDFEPETWKQTTGRGGIQMFFLYPPDWKATANAKTDVDVDIRCQGGFAVLPPTIHGETGKSYAWVDGLSPWEIPIAAAPAWLLEEVERLVREHGGGHGQNPSQNGEGFIHTPRQNGSDQFDAFGHQTDGRETKMRDMVWRVVLDWNEACPIKPSDAESAQKAQHEYEVYERDTRPQRSHPADMTLTQMLDAEGRGWNAWWGKWQRAMAQWDTTVYEEARRKDRPKEKTQSTSTGFSPSTPLALRSAFPIDEHQIPVRDWIVPGLLLKRNLSVLVAPPASGKSLLTLQLAIAVALGLGWGGWHPRKPEKVLVINAEDDFDEMRRRLFAAAQSMGVNQADLVDRIMLADAPESIVIARMDARTKSVIRTPLIEDLVATIIANDIGLVIADPFAETFEGDENSNSEVKWAGILWREVARRIRGSLLLVHHTKKYAGDMAGNADASRGGGALIGTARILSTLFTMTEDEAKLFGIPPEDRDQYVRFDDAKANHSAKGHVKWFRKVTVALNNGTGLLPGDEVGVLQPWKPPGVMDGVTARELGLALESIDRGVLADDGRPTGQLYGPTITSKDRWAGRVLERLLDIPEDKAKQMIKTWLESGVLYTVEYDDPQQRKLRTGVKVDHEKRPDRAPETFT